MRGTLTVFDPAANEEFLQLPKRIRFGEKLCRSEGTTAIYGPLVSHSGRGVALGGFQNSLDPAIGDLDDPVLHREGGGV